MSPTRIRLIALLFTSAVVTASAFQSSPVNRPWPPGVQRVPAESPVLSPADALHTFYMPPGYRVELVASEPLVQDPVVMDWDLEGRIWVVEMTGFVRDLDAPEPNLDPIGRVVVLEDTNHDGRMDTRTVFADRLVLPRALKVLDHGVLVGEPGNLWLMRDTDGDLHADTKVLVTNNYGRVDGGVEGNANSLVWGLDNWIHTSGSSEVDLRLKDGTFEVRRTLSRGEWGATEDDAGRIYRNSNESALHVDLVPTTYFARHPNLLRTRGSYDALDDNNDLNVVWPVRPNLGTNRAYQFGIDRDDGSLAKFTSVCAPMVYRGDRLPADLYGNVFVAEPAANFVSRIIVSDDGTSLRARKAYDKGEFLASTDERFRPVYLSNAPDGTLYVVDFYRGIIQDRASTTVYLRDHIVSRKLDRPTGLGRIYRVMHATTRRDTTPALVKASPSQLVAALAHPNGWRRDTAQRLLVERGASAVVPALARAAETAGDPRTRLHALWTLDGLDRITPATVTKALVDPSRDVRASAIRIAERWLGEANHPIQTEVLKRLDDTDWFVQHQLAASMGALPAGVRETAMVALLERHADDPVTIDAALSGLRGYEAAVLDALLQGSGAPATVAETPRRDIAVTMLAALIVRGAQDAAVQTVFGSIGNPQDPSWQRAALLRGAEVALLGASLPTMTVRPIDPNAVGRGATTPTAPSATPPTQVVTPPCPTCPGGRAGPGGAYAFERPPAAPTAGRGGGRPSLRLIREPAALSSLAAGADPLASRAAGVLARVEWPGKPGVAAPITPLTSAEQVRFDAGREVFKNVCQACHQPDGRGQEKVAPSLIGSALALAPPEIPIRILLNGKEGAVGLMPPVGQVFTDDQVAAVLTYVRREWGQAGTPVDPASVRSVRTAVAGRTRPWTNDELLALITGGGRGGQRE